MCIQTVLAAQQKFVTLWYLVGMSKPWDVHALLVVLTIENKCLSKFIYTSYTQIECRYAGRRETLGGIA